jgi:hypothetical protein
VQWTVVVAMGNVEPDTGEQTARMEPSSTSVPAAENVTAAPALLVASLTMLAGGVNAGGLLLTVTVNVPVAVADLESVTVQCTVVVAIGNVEPDAGAQTAAMAPSSTSVPAAENVTTAPALLVASLTILAGGVNVGGLLLTVTVNEPLTADPLESVTVQLTVVVAIANVEPDAGEQTAGITPSSTSFPAAVNVTAAPALPVASLVMLAGGTNVGGLFVTVTVNDPVAVAIDASVTVQFTVVVPSANVAPDAGVQTAGIGPSSASLPVAVNVTAAPAALVAGLVTFAGGVNVGGVLTWQYGDSVAAWILIVGNIAFECAWSSLTLRPI